MKNMKSFPVKSLLLLITAGVLLIGSAVGSTRAVLTSFSDFYTADISLASTDIALLENEQVVTDSLLGNMLENGEKLALGKSYGEAIRVRNTGSIDTFVRVILTKSWTTDDGRTKETSLSPDLIQLNLLTDNGWVIDTAKSTPERTVLYYTQALAAGATTPALSDNLIISSEIAKSVSEHRTGNTIQYVYDYNGCQFHLSAEVNAVQTSSAATAIKSAWGVDVNVSADETSISLQ